MYLVFKGQHMTTNSFAKAVGLSFHQADKLLKQGLTPDAIATEPDAALTASALAAKIGMPVTQVRTLKAKGYTVQQIKAEALV